MKVVLLFACLLPLTLADHHGITTTPPSPSYSTCILDGYPPCSTGSICSQTETCGGLCVASPTSIVQIPCTVSQSGCPTGSTCTPTMTCPPTGACGGACIATPTSIVQIPCTVSQPGCPTGSTCTPTMTCPPTGACGGACIATPTPVSSVTCVVGANNCPTSSFCYQTETCGGLCIPTQPVQTITSSTTSATPTPLPCDGPHHLRCPYGYKCVRKHGWSCGPNSQCEGTCVPN